MHGLLQTHATGLFLEGMSGTSSFLQGKSEVSLLLSGSFPSPAPQVLLVNLSEIGVLKPGKQILFYLSYRISYMLGSTVSALPDMKSFRLCSIISMFLLILNRCMMPSPRHTLFEL